MRHRTAVLVLILLCAPASARAQTYTAATDLLFYGDNTEFTNRFREGETVLGVSGRIFLEVALNDTVTLRGGVFGQGRFGAHEFLEHGEPLIALEISRGPQRFIFGSLETIATRHDVAGPDLETPHALLPPLQQETLTFKRGQEMGLQWIVGRPRDQGGQGDRIQQRPDLPDLPDLPVLYHHDAWINWQRLNTNQHRERFDAGYRAGVRLRPSLRLHGQWHVVHEGGQQFNSGAVSDSHGAALGSEWSRALTGGRLTLDAHAVATRNVPDRERPQLTEAGLGIFTRGALERGSWRTHLIVWRARDALKAEGDPNYLSARRDGTLFRKVRDYAELGLTRHFQPAPGVHVLAAVRLHRVESQYEYSYRINGRIRLRHVW